MSVKIGLSDPWYFKVLAICIRSYLIRDTGDIKIKSIEYLFTRFRTF